MQDEYVEREYRRLKEEALEKAKQRKLDMAISNQD